MRIQSESETKLQAMFTDSVGWIVCLALARFRCKQLGSQSRSAGDSRRPGL